MAWERKKLDEQGHGRGPGGNDIDAYIGVLPDWLVRIMLLRLPRIPFKSCPRVPDLFMVPHQYEKNVKEAGGFWWTPVN